MVQNSVSSWNIIAADVRRSGKLDLQEVSDVLRVVLGLARGEMVALATKERVECMLNGCLESGMACVANALYESSSSLLSSDLFVCALVWVFRVFPNQREVCVI